MKLGLVVDSTFSLPEDYIIEHKIKVVPLNVIIEGVTYKDEIDINLSQVMDNVSNGIKVTTSQPSPALFLNTFNSMKREGYTDIVCMTISSTLSGTFQSANIAASEVEGINITVIDTLSASIGAEIIARIVIDELNNGKLITEILAKVENLKKNNTILLNMENLNALKLSGRITKIKAAIGNLIRVKPILEYVTGKLNVISKFRTESSVMDYMVERLKNELSDVKTKIHVFVSHVRAMDKALRLKEKVERSLENIKVHISKEVTSVVAINLGYGGIGLAWCYE